jgi:2-dehydro-3-deoxyphosphogluconate aldolase/(4S)-4-hydroxy-2-oxoglutarate aldolase
MSEILARIADLRIVPVVAIMDAADAIPLGKALLDAGLPCAEITFRTAAAQDAIRNIVSEYPEMLIGAGTVLSTLQAEQATAAGAQFIVSPGFDNKIVEWCLERDVTITPGIATPTEINMALNYGLNILKFFPAEAMGGIKTLKAISAPFVGVRFIPTGGINVNNLKDYLSLPMVYACGGSWMVKRDLISAGDFVTITNLAKEAIKLVEEIE